MSIRRRGRMLDEWGRDRRRSSTGEADDADGSGAGSETGGTPPRTPNHDEHRRITGMSDVDPLFARPLVPVASEAGATAVAFTSLTVASHGGDAA